MSYALIYGPTSRPGYWSEVGRDIYLSCPGCGRQHTWFVSSRTLARPGGEGSAFPAGRPAATGAATRRLQCPCGFNAAITLLPRGGE